MAFARSWSAQYFRNLMNDEKTKAFGLVRGEALYAFMVLQQVFTDKQDREFEILTVVTSSENREQGYGGTLLQGALGHLYGDGATRVFLEVGVNNKAARKLYSAAGFFETGHRKAYYPSDYLVGLQDFTKPSIKANDTAIDAILMEYGFERH